MEVYNVRYKSDIIREAIENIDLNNGVDLFNDARKNGFDILDDRCIIKILNKRYNEIISYFNDDVTRISPDKIQNKMNKLIERCKRIEEPLKPQLSKLCLNTIIEMFDMPNGTFDITCNIVDEIDPKHQFHLKPDTNENFEYDDYDSIKSEDSEVKKRKLIDCVIAGGAYKLLKYAQSIYLPKLFDLDEELPHLYSKIMKLNELLLFSYVMKIDDYNHHQCGMTTVTINDSDEKCNIESSGVLFPFLMYETIKGVLELLASQGLPDIYDKAVEVINKADILQLDPTNMRIGPVIWDFIFSNTEEKTIPNVFHKLIKLKSEIIEDVFNNICFETKLGHKIVEDLNQRGKYDMEYNTFSNELLKKQSDRSMISDSYFLAEELELDNNDNRIMKLISCDPSEIEFEVSEVQCNVPFINGSRLKPMEYQLYPVVDGDEFWPEDGINFRAEEVTINGEQKYQLHIYIDPKYRRNGIASKLYEAFIKQGYPVCSLLSNRTATFNKENNVVKDGDDAIENMWRKLSDRGIDIRNINNDETIGIETY